MKKFLILFWLSFALILEAQSEKVFLDGIPFEIKIADSVKLTGADTLIVKAENGETCEIFPAGKNVVPITVNKTGKFSVFLNSVKLREIRVIPAWFAVLPPLLAILLALIFRQVLPALFSGILLGAFFLYDYNPVTAFYRVADTLLVKIIASPDHVLIILFTLIIGGVVGVISANGGTKGLAEIIVKRAKTARSGMVAGWLLGIAIFFDDYSNSLLVGNLMRPITDKLKISREKLAYIVDSTAAPVTSLVVISTWIGYELGLIGESLKTINSSLSAYDVFIQSVFYRFYPVAALVFVLMIALSKRDFGPMYKAEIKARKFGVTSDDEVLSERGNENLANKAHWLNAVLPIAILLVGTFAGLIITGKNALEDGGITNYGLSEIISASNSYYALLWGSFTSAVFAVIYTAFRKIVPFDELMNSFMKGIQSLLPAVVILILAWGISEITAKVHTADYLISLLTGNVNIKLLASFVFIICAVTSFATGTSWGTMAIVMPIVIPLTWKLGIADSLSVAEINGYIVIVVASVLAGSVFGDHCSPIADTTILSSLASGCNHISHVRTQLPYALLVGFVSLFFGSFATAFGLPLVPAYLLIFASLFAALFFFGKKTE